MSDAEQTVRTLLDAVSTRDYDGQRACLAGDFVIETPYAPTEFPNRHEGSDAFVGALQASDKAFESKVLEIDELYRLDEQDLVIAVYHTNAKTRSGDRFDQQYVGFFSMDNGLVARWREYYDPDAIRRTFKLPLNLD